MGKYSFVAAVAAAIVVVDQLTKWYIDRTMALYQSIAVIDSFFHITYLRNTGGAFGLLAGRSAAMRIPFFIAVSVLAIAVLFYFLRGVDVRQRLLLFALSGILGGAIGNFIDRILAGEVIDFLDFQWHGHHWPAFNVADSFITIGTVILLAYSFVDRSPVQNG